MQQIGVIALLIGRRAKVLKALIRIVLHLDAGAPGFVRKRRIGDDEIKSL